MGTGHSSIMNVSCLLDVVFFEVRNGFSVLYVDVIAVVLLLAIIY
jgi:hypothetical protein